MKIERGHMLPGTELARPEPSASPPAAQQSFSDVMQSRDDQITQSELKQLMNQIDLQGKRFSKGMTLRNLKDYRMLVKRFLERTAGLGVGLKETKSWDRRGRSKKLKILDEVDARLLALADELLQSEEGRLKLLEKMGEIRGLLINYLF